MSVKCLRHCLAQRDITQDSCCHGAYLDVYSLRDSVAPNRRAHLGTRKALPGLRCHFYLLLIYNAHVLKKNRIHSLSVGEARALLLRGKRLHSACEDTDFPELLSCRMRKNSESRERSSGTCAPPWKRCLTAFWSHTAHVGSVWTRPCRGHRHCGRCPRPTHCLTSNE